MRLKENVFSFIITAIVWIYLSLYEIVHYKKILIWNLPVSRDVKCLHRKSSLKIKP